MPYTAAEWRKYQAAWRAKHKERANEIARKSYAKNIEERRAAQRKENVDPGVYERRKASTARWAANLTEEQRAARRAAAKARRDANPEPSRESLRRSYRKMRTDPARLAEYHLQRRITRARLRFPPEHKLADFFASKIESFYRGCPDGWHVDHIQPINKRVGKTVIACGLHVPWNLQYLTPIDNKRKASK